MKTRPKSRKFLKAHHFKPKKPFTQQHQSKGDLVFVLVSCQATSITAEQIESARRVIARLLKTEKQSRTLVRSFPSHPVTAIPAETRMGSGKGGVEQWICPLRDGTILFEITNATEELVRSAFTKAIYKLRGKYRVEVRTG